jgi:hypothetical protein
VPPTPLSGGGIFYVCSGSILQPFGAAVAPLDPPFAHGMPALSVVAKFAATYSPRIQMPPRSQDPAAFNRIYSAADGQRDSISASSQCRQSTLSEQRWVNIKAQSIESQPYNPSQAESVMARRPVMKYWLNWGEISGKAGTSKELTALLAKYARKGLLIACGRLTAATTAGGGGGSSSPWRHNPNPWHWLARL